MAHGSISIILDNVSSHIVKTTIKILITDRTPLEGRVSFYFHRHVQRTDVYQCVEFGADPNQNESQVNSKVVSWGACWFLVEVWALWVILRDQSPTSMKLCPDAGATLEETRSSSEQVTGETVSYSVCEGPGSVLKSGGRSMDWSLFRDTQLDPGDSALSLWSWPLQHKHVFIQNTSFTHSFSEDSVWRFTCL